MQNSNLQFPKIKVDSFHVETKYAKYPLTVFLSDDGDVITGAVEFKTLCYEENMIYRFIQHYQRVLEYCLINPNSKLSEIPLLSDQEKQILLSYGIGEKRDIPKTNMVDIFEQVAKQHPDDIALVHQKSTMIYSQLCEAKNKLTECLKTRGINPKPPGSEHIIAIYMERSFDTYIAILAILSAGAAYLPLSTTLPKERIKYILKDSKVRVVLTQTRLQQTLSEGLEKSLTIIPIDNKWEILSKMEKAQAQPLQNNEISPNNLAYVIYTSGSTGKPKGVQIEHQSVINLVFAQRDILGITPQDRILAWAELTFDASVWEWISALLNGATLYIPDLTDILVGKLLTVTLTQHQISVATVPPSVLRATQLPTTNYLRIIISAGEVCQQDIVEKWGTIAQFYNAYGPTETTVCATIACCSAESKQPPTIGKPLQNTKLYVLNAQQQPVPIGMAGELCVAGSLLTRGYTKEEFTRKSFIKINDPFVHGKEIRIYKTGDTVRWLESGNLDFIGRIDEQVKVRGFRIELNEITTCLKQIEFVKDAVVTLGKERQSSMQNIVAYVVIDKRIFIQESELIKEIRNYLSSKLLYYMIPSTFSFVENIPLTPHGKTNYKALPEPESITKSAQNPPRTDTEKKLATIWANFLNCRTDQIDIYDNFFLIGGNSHMLAEMVARIKTEFKMNNFQTKDITGEGQFFSKLAKIIDDRKSIKSIFLPRTQSQKQQSTSLLRSSQQKQTFL